MTAWAAVRKGEIANSTRKSAFKRAEVNKAEQQLRGICGGKTGPGMREENIDKSITIHLEIRSQDKVSGISPVVDHASFMSDI